MNTKKIEFFNLSKEQLDYLARKVVEYQEERKRNVPLKENVRKVLISLPMLRTHLINKEKFLDELKEIKMQERSKDIIAMPTKGGPQQRSKEEILDDVLSDREIAFEETRIYVKWIDRCLHDVRRKMIEKNGNDNYYKIVELKYFKGQSLEKIAETINAAISTVKYQHRLLLNYAAVAIFGEKGID